MSVGFIFPALWLLPAAAFVIGGLLIRGQGRSRGRRWWLGWLLIAGGAVTLIYVQFTMVLLIAPA
jgi:hypothetical protein